jgi:hypothetical protein
MHAQMPLIASHPELAVTHEHCSIGQPLIYTLCGSRTNWQVSKRDYKAEIQVKIQNKHKEQTQRPRVRFMKET